MPSFVLFVIIISFCLKKLIISLYRIIYKRFERTFEVVYLPGYWNKLCQWDLINYFYYILTQLFLLNINVFFGIYFGTIKAF